MFTEFAAASDQCATELLSEQTSIGPSSLVAALAAMPILLATLAFSSEKANALPPTLNANQCWRQLNTCNANCDRYPPGMFTTSCYNRCASQYRNCLKVANGIDPYPRPIGADNSIPPVGTKPDPKKPPKPRNDVPPNGGAKADPKPQKPRDDVRPSGGTKADPKPQSPGNGGPILLRKNGAGQPNSSGGASARANGRK